MAVMTSKSMNDHDVRVPGLRHYILGTAGHIDHGKTSLVRALTGTDTDRLPEERRRGMTIELGFAELVTDDVCFGIVDVPGHERFVRTMVAGATGIDVGLLVVAADDSVMPQTLEHVEILHLLGVRHAVIAITKVDAVDEDMAALVEEEVRELVANTPLKDAPICRVSSVTGTGVEELKHALVSVSRDVEPTRATGPFCLTVDRVFTIQGRGTVVTGSAIRGSVSIGDTLQVWPANVTCRVRDLQAHGRSHETLARGQRCAINLSGIDREHLERGAELATPGYLQPSRLLDVRLDCLDSYTKPLKSTSVVRLEIGTAELPARVVLLGEKTLQPGQSNHAQLRSGVAVTAAYGQRFIIRDENATRTIGGGIVLRPVARRRRGDVERERTALVALENGAPEDRLEDVLRVHGFHAPSDLSASCQSGIDPDDLGAVRGRLEAAGRWRPIPGTDIYVVPSAVDEITNRLVRWLERFHRKNPDNPGRPTESVVGWLERLTRREVAKPIVDELIKTKKLKRFGRFICLPSFAPQLSNADEKLLNDMVRAILDAGFQPPTLDEFSAGAGTDKKRIERLATLAVAMGDLVKVDGKIYLHAETDARLRRVVADVVRDTAGATVAEIREALDSSRKFVVPFMEYLDRVGYTRRIGDRRLLADADG